MLSFYLKCLTPSRHCLELETNCICQTKQSSWSFQLQISRRPRQFAALSKFHMRYREHTFPLFSCSIHSLLRHSHFPRSVVLWHFPKLLRHKDQPTLLLSKLPLPALLRFLAKGISVASLLSCWRLPSKTSSFRYMVHGSDIYTVYELIPLITQSSICFYT